MFALVEIRSIAGRKSRTCSAIVSAFGFSRRARDAALLPGFLMAIVSCAATVAHAGDQCIVYENRNFDGHALALDVNQSLPVLRASLDNKISSVRVQPGCILVGFADANFKGPSQTWGPGDYATLPKRWDDVISSAQCNCSPQ